jgi:hypothetical protein
MIGRTLVASSENNSYPRACAHLPYTQVLAALGLEAETLPATLPCPLCRGQLTIWPDGSGYAEWFHCPDCQRSGELIELASAAWQTDTRTALLRLHDAGVRLSDYILADNGPDRYETEVLGRRKKLERYWQTACSRPLAESNDHLALHALLGADAVADPARYTSRLSGLLADSTAAEVQTAFSTGDVVPTQIQGIGAAYKFGHARLPGRGWRELIAAAAHDLPGRLAGLWFAGRGLNPSDWAYLPAGGERFRRMGPGQVRDSGLAFLDAVRHDSRLFGRTAVVVSDPEVAFRCHVRYARSHEERLPLALSCAQTPFGNRLMWGNLPSRDWVFWAPWPSGELLEQARAAGGRIAFVPETAEKAAALPESFVHLIIDRALPWNVALGLLAAQLDDGPLETLVRRMATPAEAWEEALALVQGRDIRARLIAARGEPARETVMAGATYKIVERDGRWYADPGGDLVADALLRVDHLWVHESALHPHVAQGRILYEGVEIPFALTAVDLRVHVRVAIEHHLARAGLGPPRLHASRRHHLVDMSYLFHKPEIVRVRSAAELPTLTGRYGRDRRTYSERKKKRSQLSSSSGDAATARPRAGKRAGGAVR